MSAGGAASPSRRYEIGLVGCGKWGRHILRDLLSLDCSVTVVARSGALPAACGEGAKVVTTIDELGDVDGALVAVPTTVHGEVVEALLPWKIPVFVEKPLTSDVASARRIAEAAPDRVFVMDKWRYHPGIEMLGHIARSGELGPVIGLETTRVGFGNPHDDVDGTWVLTPHDLSIALEVLGHIPEPAEARADLVDGQAAGLIALLGHSPWLRLEVGTRTVWRRREVILRCRDGIAALGDAYNDHIEVLTGYPTSDQTPEPMRRSVSAELPLLRELRAFLAHLDGGPPPRSSAAEGALMVETVARLRAMAGLEP